VGYLLPAIRPRRWRGSHEQCIALLQIQYVSERVSAASRTLCKKVDCRPVCAECNLIAPEAEGRPERFGGEECCAGYPPFSEDLQLTGCVLLSCRRVRFSAHGLPRKPGSSSGRSTKNCR